MKKTIKLLSYSAILSGLIATHTIAQNSTNFAIGDTSGTDYGYAVQPTNDGNLIIAGKSSSFPPSPDYLYSDGFISKINPTNKAILWSKQYRLAVPQIAVQYDRSDIFWGMKAVENGNFIIAGTSSDTTGLPSLGPVILKTDGNGNPIWSRYLTGNGFGNQGYTAAYNPTDNTYLLGGTILPLNATQQLEAFIAKFDIDGNTIWAKTYGTTGAQVCRNLLQVTGGWLMIGVTTPPSSSNTDIFVSKINDNGVLQWTKTYGGLYEDRVNGACLLNNGNVLLTGFASRATATGNESLLALTINPADGSVIWAKSYSNTGTTIGNTAIAKTGQTSVTIAGYTNTAGPTTNDAFIITVNETDGSAIQQATTGSNLADALFSGIAAPNGGYYFVGNTAITDPVQGNDIYIVNSDATSPNCPWSTTPASASTLPWTATNLTITTNTAIDIKDYPFDAFAQPFTAQEACFTLTTDPIITPSFFIAPNPTSGNVILNNPEAATLNVYNSLGQFLFSQDIREGANNITKTESLLKGIYIFQIITKNSMTSQQVVKL